MNIVILQRIGYPNHLFKPQKQLYHEETFDIFHSIIDGGTLFIQNQTLSDNGYYEAHTIKVGNQVTSTQSQGDVNFTQGHHQLVGKEVELHPGTTVSTGATLEIRNN